MKIVSLSIVCISIFLFACNSETHHNQEGHANHKQAKGDHEEGHEKGKNSEHQHHQDHNKSNHHMNKNSFEDLAKRFESNERASWQRPAIVLQQLGDIKGKKIADIGAGTGYFAFRMANLGAKVTAIDVDERFINFIDEKIAKEKTSHLITKLVGHDNPELTKNSFDFLVIIDTYHHFNDKVDYLTHCFNGLKEGGVLMNVDFKHEKTDHGPPLDHRIAAEEVKKDLLEAGFTDIEIDQKTLIEQYIITAKKKAK